MRAMATVVDRLWADAVHCGRCPVGGVEVERRRAPPQPLSPTQPPGTRGTAETLDQPLPSPSPSATPHHLLYELDHLHLPSIHR